MICFVVIKLYVCAIMIKRAVNLPIITNDVDLLAAYIIENDLVWPGCTDVQLINIATELLIDPKILNNEEFYMRLFEIVDPFFKIKITW